MKVFLRGFSAIMLALVACGSVEEKDNPEAYNPYEMLEAVLKIDPDNRKALSAWGIWPCGEKTCLRRKITWTV